MHVLSILICQINIIFITVITSHICSLLNPPYIIYANQPRKPALNALLYNLHIMSWSRPWSPPRTGPAGNLKSLYEQSLPLSTGCRPDIVHVPQGAVRSLSSDTALRPQVNVPFGTWALHRSIGCWGILEIVEETRETHSPILIGAHGSTGDK